MKFFLKKSLVFVILFFFFFLISCDRSVEIKKTFTFETSFRPDAGSSPDAISAAMTNAMNEALIDVARNSKQDSVMQFASKEENLSIIYKDIAFLPVLNADDLKDIINDHVDEKFRLYKKEDYSSEAEAIDFNKNFVLIVAHPQKKITINSGEINNIGSTYLDKILDKGIKNNRYIVKLESGRLGNLSSGLETLMQKWDSDVYVLEKKNADSLSLELNDEIYNFSIKK